MTMKSYNDFSRERLAGYDPVVTRGGKVLVAGLGALGQNVAINLALSGVGELRFVDFDDFESHNRTRSPLFPTKSETVMYGLSKACVAAHKTFPLMTASHPMIRFAACPIQLLGDGAFDGVDVVIACVDSTAARAYLADKCRWLGITLVEAGFNGSQLSLAVFPAVVGSEAQTAACWRCTNRELIAATSCRLYAENAEKLGIIPAIQNGAATLAGLQAESAIQALHKEYPLGQKRLFIDVRSGESQIVNLTAATKCPGGHMHIGASHESLSTTAAAPVSELLHELASKLAAEATIQFSEFSGWIRSMPCTKCRQDAIVEEPVWAWLMKPKCIECGGKYPRAVENGPAPVIEVEIGSHSSFNLLSLSGSKLGLSPLSVVSTYSAGQPPRFWRLPGTLDDLFTTIQSQES